MKETLTVGITHEKKFVTTPQMGVSHLGDGPGVLSTPSMLGLMEQTSMDAAQAHLDDNERTVGTMVHIWHKSAVNIGEEVTVWCKMIEQDRRKLLFEVKVTFGDQVIGEGTHERFVINLDKFNQ